MKPERRNSYRTRRSLKSDEFTSLEDLITVGKMAENISVSKIIDTEQGILCYTYDD